MDNGEKKQYMKRYQVAGLGNHKKFKMVVGEMMGLEPVRGDLEKEGKVFIFRILHPTWNFGLYSEDNKKPQKAGGSCMNISALQLGTLHRGFKSMRIMKFNEISQTTKLF